MPAAKPVPNSQPASASARALRRQDDDQRFCQRFAALAAMQARSASIEGLPPEFLARSVAPPPVLLQRHGAALAARTYNALSRYEPRPQEPPFTFRRLLDLRGFGLFSLLDLLEAMGQAPGPPTSPP
jgi:hypothetical protein